MLRMITSAFIIVFAASNSVRGVKPTDSIGLQLGLPLNSDISGNRSKDVPNFLLDVYACWSSTSSSSCPHILPKSSLEGANVVRAIKGRALQPTKVAVLSHKLKYALMIPFDFKFDLTITGKRIEKVHSVYIHVPKRGLSRSDQEAIKAKCDINSGVQLVLHIQVKTPESTLDVVTLNTTLFSNDIKHNMSVNFTDTTQYFEQWLIHKSSYTPHFLQGRIVVGGACYGLLNPADLGIGSTTKESPWIVIISKSEDAKEAFLRASLDDLAAKTAARYHTRDTSHTVVENEEPDSGTELPSHSHGDNIPCRQYTHTMKFADLGWDEHVISPESFNINYCSGSCNFPQITHKSYNTTKQSYIQSFGAYNNPELVPRPCCVPHEYSDVTLLYYEQTTEVVIKKWKNIAAASCGCK